MIWGIWCMTRGFTVAFRTPSASMSSLNAAMYLSATSGTVEPVSADLRISLSSTSVKFMI